MCSVRVTQKEEDGFVYVLFIHVRIDDWPAIHFNFKRVPLGMVVEFLYYFLFSFPLFCFSLKSYF